MSETGALSREHGAGTPGGLSAAAAPRHAPACWCEIVNGKRQLANGCPRHDPVDAVRAVEFVPQLLAAIDRHEEARTWASWASVMVARGAVLGEEYAQAILCSESSWQLTSEGLLP